MRVLVCGGRDYADYAYVEENLNDLPLGNSSVIIHGGAQGADRLAERWAFAHGVDSERFSADWEKHGKAAGPIRNQRMIDEGQPDLVVAFPGGKGTADMIRRARAAGVDVVEL